ncbi:MAG: TlpA disulfide reductase family protein, partial [Actinomycetota bacterium]
MSQRNAKRARREQRAAAPAPRGRKRGLNRTVITAVVVAVVAALVGGYFAARGTGPAGTSHVSGAASGALALSGTDPVTGRHVDLATFRGKPLVVNVWGSWCEGCIAEAADLERFARSHPAVQVVGIDTQDTSGGAKAFYRQWGWHHPSIADPHGQLAAQLGIQ